MNSILLVKHYDSEFFVLAEKNFILPDKNLIDITTHASFSAEQLKYALTKLEDGKPMFFIGYISSTDENLAQLLLTKAHPNSLNEYVSSPLIVTKKIYDIP